jgi:hypothetical protein
VGGARECELTGAAEHDGLKTMGSWLRGQPASLEAIVQAARPAGDTRTRAQQLADALVQLADNQLAAGGLPFLRTVEPNVGVTIPLADLVDPSTGPGSQPAASAPLSPPRGPAGPDGAGRADQLVRVELEEGHPAQA